VIADPRNFNPSGEGCVDQSGFLSCYKSQAVAAVDCENFCVTSTKKGSEEAESCSRGCGGHWLAANIGCWIQSCWNEVRTVREYSSDRSADSKGIFLRISIDGNLILWRHRPHPRLQDPILSAT
jgi:hypothetical protein